MIHKKIQSIKSKKMQEQYEKEKWEREFRFYSQGMCHKETDMI